MEKMTWDGPKWGREGLFLANLDLADISGNMDEDFENSHVLYFFGFKFLDVQVSRFPKSGLGQAWARLGGA